MIKDAPLSMPKTNKKETVLEDYKIAWISRHVSFMGRKEVLTGKAKFGIFGAGKELPQVIAAKFFKNGDFRSGYYRDQTFMLAAGLVTPKQLFAQLYANPNKEFEPHSSGRQMNAHFATPSVNTNGEWNNLMKQKNSAADISCTSGQMARAVGLAMASKKYREIKDLPNAKNFSNNGNEICFATIGDASTSEGLFWEAVNAAGVTKIPLAINIWDDGYGISVPTKYQTTKGNISTVLSGFEINENGDGYNMYTCKAWDYEGLLKMYDKGIAKIRKDHNPAIFHITECTQPQGHSTSGSHERYKDKERLQFEKDFDCLRQMRLWMLATDIADEAELDAIEKEAKGIVQKAKKEAWEDFLEPIEIKRQELLTALNTVKEGVSDKETVQSAIDVISKMREPSRRDLVIVARQTLHELYKESTESKTPLAKWVNSRLQQHREHYGRFQYSLSDNAAPKIKGVEAVYSDKPKKIPGFQILNKCFEAAFNRHPELLAFGEDVGQIGDVNQGFAGLQEIFGKERIFDTGIREATIMGQAAGLSMRGFRPIAEIQYLDYFIWGMQVLSDDVATLHYRSAGQQKAPVIIRTRGHRLEGIWHTGSPIAMVLNAVRGMWVCVPRNMTQAAGLYNTLIKSDEPAIVIESLNGYRLREALPENIGEFCVPLGTPDILREGEDVTIVTYGSCVRVAEAACEALAKANISCELIDIQTILPFDLSHSIVQSLQKTNKIVFMDEDVPGGATTYMMQKVLEEQQGYKWLDAQPITITAMENRSPYGSEGDYVCKPSAEDVFEKVYTLMHEYNPTEFPVL